MIPTRQAECIFKKCPTCEDRFWKGVLQPYREWCISPRPADDHLFVFNHFYDRVIAPHKDIPVMYQKIVCNIFESCKGFVVFISNWLIAHVTAGHNERQPGFSYYKMMEWGIRQHYPKIQVVRGNVMWNATITLFFQQDNWSLCRQ